jgi:chromosome segregation ATPase
MSTEINDMLAKHPYIVSNSTASRSSSPEHNQTKRLAQALQTQTGLVEDLNQQLQKQTSQVSSLHQENVRLRNELQQYHEHEISTDHRQKELELNGLKEQLKVHIQTIDILVEEKSAIQGSLHKQQTLALEKTRECEELMQRLQACHKRVKDMEILTDDLTSQQKHHQQEFLLHQKQSASLQDTVHQLNNERDELKQELQELKQRLESQMTQCQQLEEANDQLQSKLSMSETLVQQLSSGGHGVDKLEQTLKESREKNQRVTDQLGQVTRLLQTVAAERDHLSHQNTEVVEQYEGKLQQLTAQITALANERGALVAHLQQQTALVKELENRNVSEDVSEKLQAELEQAATDKTDLSIELQAQAKENEQLQRHVDEQTAEIVQLQSTVKRLTEEAVDRTEMLRSMQNDKETISRLLLQNKELKSQLEELQTGFVRVTNDKMRLASDLQTYEHHNKQLKAQLDEQKVEDDTDSENVALKEQIQHLQEEKLRLADRLSQLASVEMSHHTTPDPNELAQLVDKLKQELSTSQHTIQQLSAENSGLQTTLLTLQSHTLNESSAVSDGSDISSSNSLEPQEHLGGTVSTTSVPTASQVDAVAALTARTHQLQVERHQLAQQLLQQKEAYEQHLRALQESGNPGLGDRGTGDMVEQSVTVSHDEYDQLEFNFNQLQVCKQWN